MISASILSCDHAWFGRDAASAAAAPGLHQITVFRGEPGLDDVVDLAGHTGKTLRQAAPLKLCNAAAIGQAVHNEGCDRI